MRQQRITFHFTETDTTGTLPALDWLMGEIVDRPSCTHLILVADHVTQTLVKHHAQVYVAVQFFARNAAVHWLISVVLIASQLQLLTEMINGLLLLTELEWRRVLRNAMQCTSLSSHRLDKLTDGHTGRESVRIDDDVWRHARL